MAHGLSFIRSFPSSRLDLFYSHFLFLFLPCRCCLLFILVAITSKQATNIPIPLFHLLSSTSPSPTHPILPMLRHCSNIYHVHPYRTSLVTPHSHTRTLSFSFIETTQSLHFCTI